MHLLLRDIDHSCQGIHPGKTDIREKLGHTLRFCVPRISREVRLTLKRGKRGLFRIANFNIHAENQRLVIKIQLRKDQKPINGLWSIMSERVKANFLESLEDCDRYRKGKKYNRFSIAIYDTFAKSQFSIHKIQQKK